MTTFISYQEAKDEIVWYFDVTGDQGAAVFVPNLSGPGYELLEKRVDIDDIGYGGDNTFVSAEDARRLSKEFGIDIEDL